MVGFPIKRFSISFHGGIDKLRLSKRGYHTIIIFFVTIYIWTSFKFIIDVSQVVRGANAIYQIIGKNQLFINY